MNVKQLIEKLQKVDPEALVVVRGCDHSYDKAHAFTDFADKVGDHLSEWYKDCAEGEKIPVLVVE